MLSVCRKEWWRCQNRGLFCKSYFFMVFVLFSFFEDLTRMQKVMHYSKSDKKRRRPRRSKFADF